MSHNTRFFAQSNLLDRLIFRFWVAILAFLGVIIQYETTGYSWTGMIFWVSATLLLIYGLLVFRLEIDSAHQVLILHRPFHRKKIVQFKNIRITVIHPKLIRIRLKHPTYLQLDLKLRRKRIPGFIQILQKNHVKMITVGNITQPLIKQEDIHAN